MKLSPGVTFERVYRELKRRLADGTLKPGEPIEPAALRDDLAASITPIRDALHRLVGEQLVEAPNHNGFRVPRLSEAELRDLYLWNGHLLVLAIRQTRPEALTRIAEVSPEMEPDHLFFQIAKATGSAEHAQAIDRLNDRLVPSRRIEAKVLENMAAELSTIRNLLGAAERTQLARALMRYHHRRAIAVPDILRAATAG